MSCVAMPSLLMGSTSDLAPIRMMQISVDAIQAPHASEEVTVFAAQSLLRKVMGPGSLLRRGTMV